MSLRGFAKDSETLETMVVYRLDDDSFAFPPAEEAETEDNGLLAVMG